MQAVLPNCPVFLSGPPGAGKTWLCRRAGARLGVPVMDTDEEVERQTGLSPAQLIRGPGEKVLRRAERDVVRHIPDGTRLVALGGGTLVADETRTEVRRRGPVVSLTASADTLWERLQSSSSERPLVTSRAQLDDLLRQREPVYGTADWSVSTEGDPDGVVTAFSRSVQDVGFVRVVIGAAESRVLIGSDLQAAAAAALLNLKPTRPVVFIEDEGVPAGRRNAYAEALAQVAPMVRVPVEGGEAIKTLERLGRVLESAVAQGCGRQSVVVGMGGGATTDFAGMMAGLMARGAPLIAIPSTLLAQVDASVGGKCAVNLEAGKNLAGLFHPASDVLVDRTLLESLPADEWRSGLAETFKMALLVGEPLFSDLVRDPSVSARELTRAIAGKAGFVATDPFEAGPRKSLNLGHTLGHALERASGYRMRHGDAVSVGIAAMVRWSRRRGLLSGDRADAILDAQRRLGLPMDVDPKVLEAALPHLTADKKGSAAEATVVALTDLGEPALIRVSWEQLRRELASVED